MYATPSIRSLSVATVLLLAAGCEPVSSDAGSAAAGSTADTGWTADTADVWGPDGAVDLGPASDVAASASDVAAADTAVVDAPVDVPQPGDSGGSAKATWALGVFAGKAFDGNFSVSYLSAEVTATGEHVATSGSSACVHKVSVVAEVPTHLDTPFGVRPARMCRLELVFVQSAQSGAGLLLESAKFYGRQANYEDASHKVLIGTVPCQGWVTESAVSEVVYALDLGTPATPTTPVTLDLNYLPQPWAAELSVDVTGLTLAPQGNAGLQHEGKMFKVNLAALQFKGLVHFDAIEGPCAGP